MGISGYSHAWRAVVLAWGMAWFGPAADLSAGALDPTASLEPAGRSADRSGFSPRRCPMAACGKMAGRERKLDDERVQLASATGIETAAPSPAALSFLAIVDNARARDGPRAPGRDQSRRSTVDRSMSDMAQHGAIDV